jgi:cytochrome c oxidase subunit 4
MQATQEPNTHVHHHHILPTKVALTIGLCLFILTGLTVYAAQIDFGRLNFFIALLIAAVKASLVCLFFMNLLYDRKENAFLFATSFLFLAIFITLTGADLFFRGNVYVDQSKPFFTTSAGATAKFKRPWVASPDLIAHGKEIFEAQCTPCHGPQGFGDGPAAASLNPHPRNFHAPASEWTNGRKITDIFGTLTHGLGPMPSFAALPVVDRWAVGQYVQSLGGAAPQPTAADFAKLGVNPNQDLGTAGGAPEAKTIPVDIAIDQMIREAGNQP